MKTGGFSRAGMARGCALAAACLLVEGSAVASERLAPGASSCSACHGTGSSTSEPPLVPALGGLSAAEIESALAAYRSGARTGSVMPRIAKGFSASESRAIAAALGRDRMPTP